MTRAKRISWILGVVMIAVFMMGIVPAAMAAEENEDIIVTQKANGVEIGGKVSLSFTVHNKSSDEVTIYGVYPNNNQSVVTAVDSTDIPAAGYLLTSDTDESFNIVVSVSNTVSAGLKKVNFNVIYTKAGSSSYQELNNIEFSFNKTSVPPATEDPSPTPAPGGTEISALVLDPTRLDGTVLAAPKGDAGDTIKIILPIRNRASHTFGGDGNVVSNAEITPVITADLNTFPFEVQEMAYLRTVPTIAPGGKAEVTYDFKISKNATSGVKVVTFNAVYDLDGEKQTAQFTVFVNVIKGAAPDTGTKPTSVPKIIIDSYSLSSEKLFAGDEFKLTMNLTNTSDSEGVKNLKITVKDENGKILPAANGSNTLYVKKIAKGDTVTCEIGLGSAPDTEAKSHTLSVSFNYEGATTLTAYDTVETLSLPISQRIRLKIDDPVIYADSAMIEQPVGMYFSLYNMGKATIYNCMVSVEGDGLRMEETFFGGNIGSGSSMQADFSVIPSIVGQIPGKIVITYEDVFGEQMREEKPFELFVQEQYIPPEGEFPGKPGDPGVFNPEMPVETQQGMPGWLIIVLAVVGLAAVIVGVRLLMKAKRKKELEEI